MAAEVRSYAVQIPAGTTQAAPFVQSVAFPTRIVTQVNWRVPRGPSGLMGWRLTMGGVQVIPLPDGAWLVADDAHGEWPMSGQPVTGQWELTGYNTGVYAHTVYVDFLLDLVAPAVTPAAVTAGTPAPTLAGVGGQITTS